MQLASDHVVVKVPATSANLGPGFDALGMALDVWDEVEARAVAGPSRVRVEGEGAGDLPGDETHLVVRAAQAALELVGAPAVGLDLQCRNTIPQGRGLGSSAAAVVAGALIARGLIANPSALNARTVFKLAGEFEGHLDNVAPAIFGGATIAWSQDGQPRAARLDVSPEVGIWLAIPPQTVSTRVARAVLPERVDRQDAAFTAGRAALLAHALTTEPTLLFDATEDRLHQPHRAAVMPDTAALVTHLRERGVAAAISGAGPAVIALGTSLPPWLSQAAPRDWLQLTPAPTPTPAQVARIQPA
jgi:homoserine kinase